MASEAPAAGDRQPGIARRNIELQREPTEAHRREEALREVLRLTSWSSDKGNASKFTDRGEVRIAAALRNGQFAASVSDTGPGIASEEQTRIFAQFHQVDSCHTKAKGGLGLAIAKPIMEMHRGRIWVESTLGKGATFQLELPILAQNQKATV